MAGDCQECAAARVRYQQLAGAVASTLIWIQQQLDAPQRLRQGFIYELQERLEYALRDS